MERIWTNDVSEFMNDESYQRNMYDDYLESGGDLDFDTWLEKDFYQDYDLWEIDYDLVKEDFDYNIIPMIENSPSMTDFPTTKQWGRRPPLFLVGSRSGWRAGSGGFVWETVDDMRKQILYPNYDSTTTIYNDNGEMYISQSDHDGTTSGTLCTFTSDESALLTCLWKDTIYPDDLEYLRRIYQDGLTDDELILEAFYDDICTDSESIAWDGFIGTDCLVPVKI